MGGKGVRGEQWDDGTKKQSKREKMEERAQHLALRR